MEGVITPSTAEPSTPEGVITKTQKNPRPVIERTIAIHDKVVSGKTRRIVVVHYRYNRDTEELTYGAVVHKRLPNRHPELRKVEVVTDAETGEKKEIVTWIQQSEFNFASHSKAAQGRFAKHPVKVTGVKDTGTLKDFNLKVRGMLFKHGCSSKPKKTTE